MTARPPRRPDGCSCRDHRAGVERQRARRTTSRGRRWSASARAAEHLFLPKRSRLLSRRPRNSTRTPVLARGQLSNRESHRLRRIEGGRSARRCCSERRASSTTAASAARLAGPRPLDAFPGRRPPCGSRWPATPPKASSTCCASCSTEGSARCAAERHQLGIGQRGWPWASSFARSGIGGRSLITGRRRRGTGLQNHDPVYSNGLCREPRAAGVVPDPALTACRAGWRRHRQHLRRQSCHALAGHRRTRGGAGAAPARPGRRHAHRVDVPAVKPSASATRAAAGA